MMSQVHQTIELGWLHLTTASASTDIIYFVSICTDFFYLVFFCQRFITFHPFIAVLVHYIAQGFYPLTKILAGVLGRRSD